MPTADLVQADSIEAAARTLAGVVVRTPLLAAPWVEGQGAEVRLKCENLQRAGAFKIRGAYTMMARLSAAEREPGVIAYSSGNHAQGVALAARLFGVRSVVVMPTTAPAVKREGAERLGAEVILEGTTSVERQRRAQREAEQRGLTIIPAFDHPDIIAGQGTVGVEILEDWPAVDTVVAPIGGGGLISGTAAWVKRARPNCRIVGVEPDGADAMRQSIDAGRPVSIDLRPSIADGLMPVRPGDLTYAHVSELVDDVVRVSDAEILDATRQVLARGKLIVEFSGAATLAAVMAGRVPGKRCVAILSGGNLDPVRALELLGSPVAGVTS
jgi:threonine dehydratase